MVDWGWTGGLVLGFNSIHLIHHLEALCDIVKVLPQKLPRDCLAAGSVPNKTEQLRMIPFKSFSILLGSI